MGVTQPATQPPTQPVIAVASAFREAHTLRAPVFTSVMVNVLRLNVHPETDNEPFDIERASRAIESLVPVLQLEEDGMQEIFSYEKEQPTGCWRFVAPHFLANPSGLEGLMFRYERENATISLVVSTQSDASKLEDGAVPAIVTTTAVCAENKRSENSFRKVMIYTEWDKDGLLLRKRVIITFREDANEVKGTITMTFGPQSEVIATILNHSDDPMKIIGSENVDDLGSPNTSQAIKDMWEGNDPLALIVGMY